MTSEQIVARAKINARLEAARRSGDVPEMQRCLAEDTAVLQSAYGVHLAGEPDLASRRKII
jgi:hypothetical protein